MFGKAIEFIEEIHAPEDPEEYFYTLQRQGFVMEEAFNSLPYSFMVADAAGQVLIANPRAAEYLGVDSYTRIIGRSVALHPENLTPPQIESWFSDLRSGQIKSFELTLQNAGGRDIRRKIQELPPEKKGQCFYFVQDEDLTRSLRDNMTGLYNRNFYIEKLPRISERYQKEQKCFAVIMGDLNRFKQINDTYGHEAGDEALKASAGRIAAVLRAEDIVVRLGGDEFLIVIRLSRPADAEAVIAKLRAAVSKPLRGYQEIIPSASFGAEVFVPGGAVLTLEQMTRAADEKMYADKKGLSAGQL
ncbi:MAG: GGDEF domain-containing protein [Candidatus Margulisbacteria bacterium]|jgi:diguanylate cyclase (GGDEF)-like protein|nr:GGDEF domain-containing protein [Candidatus Margulisiibacteriota bacterium]